MTRDALDDGQRPEDEPVRVGTEADEARDAEDAGTEAAAAMGDDDLAEAGLPREGAGDLDPDAAGLAGAPALQRRGRSGRRRQQPADLQGHRRRRAAVPGRDGLPGLQLRHRLRGREQLPAPGHRAAARARCATAAEDAGAEVAIGADRRRRHRPAAHRARSTATPSAPSSRRSPTPPGSTPTRSAPSRSAPSGAGTSPSRRSSRSWSSSSPSCSSWPCASSPRWRSVRWPPCCTTSSSPPASTR